MEATSNPNTITIHIEIASALSFSAWEDGSNGSRVESLRSSPFDPPPYLPEYALALRAVSTSTMVDSGEGGRHINPARGRSDGYGITGKAQMASSLAPWICRGGVVGSASDS